MPHYAFPGYPVFLQAAAREVGRPEAVNSAHRIATLGALANLCAQAGAAGPALAPPILAKAEEFRDQLRVAHRAAEMMLDEVREALGLPQEGSPKRRTTRAEPPARR